MIIRRAWPPLSVIVKRLGTALWVSSIATAFLGCSEGHYSLGSPGSSENAGGNADAQGKEFAASGSAMTAADSGNTVTHHWSCTQHFCLSG